MALTLVLYRPPPPAFDENKALPKPKAKKSRARKSLFSSKLEREVRPSFTLPPLLACLLDKARLWNAKRPWQVLCEDG